MLRCWVLGELRIHALRVKYPGATATAASKFGESLPVFQSRPPVHRLLELIYCAAARSLKRRSDRFPGASPGPGLSIRNRAPVFQIGNFETGFKLGLGPKQIPNAKPKIHRQLLQLQPFMDFNCFFKGANTNIPTRPDRGVCQFTSLICIDVHRCSWQLPALPIDRWIRCLIISRL